jgi:hypothetical protein
MKIGTANVHNGKCNLIIKRLHFLFYILQNFSIIQKTLYFYYWYCEKGQY